MLESNVLKGMDVFCSLLQAVSSLNMMRAEKKRVNPSLLAGFDRFAGLAFRQWLGAGRAFWNNLG
jgi:hypothetical protein